MSTTHRGNRPVPYSDAAITHPSSMPSEYAEVIWETATQIDVTVWNQLRPSDDIFMDCRLLVALESSMADTSQFRYLLYQDKTGAAVAIAVLCTFTIDVGVLANDDWSIWFLAKLRRLSPKLVQFRILFCGQPISAAQSCLRIAAECDQATVLKQLDQTMNRLARQDRASVIVFKEFADDELPRLTPLESLGYRKADSLPTYFIPLPDGTYEGYLKEIGTKSRNNIQRSVKKFAASGIELVTTSDFSTIERLMTPQTYQLYESVLERSKTKFEVLPREFFLEMARQLPDCCEFIFALQGEQVCGFTIALMYGGQYTSLYIGYDESINAETHLYFNLSLRNIQDATRYHASIIEMGQNADDVKRLKFRAKLSNRSIYVRGSGFLIDSAIKILFKQLFPPRSLTT